MPWARARSSWTASWRPSPSWSRISQRGLGVALGQLAGQADVHGQRHQVLLGAVVEVALDLAPGRVGGGHDAGPGRLQLVGLAPHLVEGLLQGGVELDVVQGQPDLAGQLGEHGVVVGR